MRLRQTRLQTCVNNSSVSSQESGEHCLRLTPDSLSCPFHQTLKQVALSSKTPIPTHNLSAGFKPYANDMNDKVLVRVVFFKSIFE